MKRLAAIAILGALAAPALAKGDDEEKTDDSSEDEDVQPKAKKKNAKQKDAKQKEDKDDKQKDEGDDEDKKKDDEEEEKPPSKLQKQDLNGHDLGTDKRDNVFEKDRFFVDKVDSDKTEKGTLVQGSLTSSSFVYKEQGGNYPMAQGQDNGGYTRLFTDLRLQTDFRHIGGGHWEGRFDFRTRFVTTPQQQVDPAFQPTDPTHVQSGFNGTNEYDLKEAWLVRNGDKSDVFLGRQFVPDLGAVKIDGLRIDYASSQKFTLIGFAGLYPIRGSRSLTTDYTELKTNEGADAGKFTGAGGFGAAYRTTSTYGAFGGVALVPFKAEQPRFYGTSTGYWRYTNQLDFYHFAIIDVLGSNAVNAGLTNISAGVNYKPGQRLRLTASYNRVDTDTLNVQANAFLGTPDQANSVVSNEVFISRLATTQLRGGVSAGLGELQRFELSTSVAYRFRPSFTLTSPDGNAKEAVQAAQGVEFYAALTDRHSIANMRLGVDFSRTIAVGDLAYQRSEVSAFRAMAGRELAEGRGEWEAELSYASTKDANAGMTCDIMAINTCYGASAGTIVSLGGNLYYRFSRDWFMVASAYVSRTMLDASSAGMTTTDPTITGLTGFFRLAYRF